MNEVEKMYKNAGVKKEVIPCPAIYYGYDCTRNNWDDEACSCDIEGYPPFTAEKQLELIKWLAKFDDFYVLKDFEFDKYRSLCGLVASEYIDTFEEMLANLILNIWDELTKAQKKQIKEILSE